MLYDTFTELNQAYEVVQTKWRQGNIIGAYDDLCNIFAYRLLHSRLNASDAKIIQTLADVSSILGEFETADNLLCGAIYLHEEAKREFWANHARLRRILLCIDRGNLYQAQDLLKEMAPNIGDINNIEFSSGLLQWEEGCIWSNLNTEEKTIIFTDLYLIMGRLLAALGQYGEAITALQRSSFHCNSETAPDLAKSSLLPIQLTYAGVLIEKGNLEEADIYLSEVRELVYQPEHIQHRLRYLELSGKLNLLIGNLGGGLDKLQQVQALCSTLRLQQGVLRANLNLAHTLILLNKTSAAQDYLKKTQVKASDIGDTHLAARAQLLLQLCHARSRGISPIASVWEMCKREPLQATIEIKGKLDLSSQSPNYLAWFEDRSLAFHSSLSELNLEKTNQLLQHIKNIFNTDSDLIQVQIRVLEGILCYYQGTERNSLDEIHRAHEILMSVSPQLEALHLKPELWQVQRIIIWCRTRLNYPLSQIEPLTASTNDLLEQMNSTLKPEDQVLYLLNKWTANEEYIATRINHLQRLQQKINKANILQRAWLKLKLIRSLNALVEDIDKYKGILAKRTTTGAKEAMPTSNKSMSVWRRLFTHPQDRVTLTFLILPDRALVIITGLLLFDFHIIPTTRLAVRNLVQNWYKNIENINRSRDINLNNNQYNQSVEQTLTDNLANILQIPQILERIPKQIKSLTIVPDDILHGFPFATIIYKGKYLIEHYKLSISYESKAKHIKSSSFLKKAKALVVGISKGNNQYNSLPGVNKELKYINGWLNSRKINSLTLHNSTAHKDAVIESISKVSLLHIACHGAFNSSQPDQSGLVLIDEDGQQEILTLRELSQINLSKLHHATLSSCWSANNFILPGRWIISLPETLWRSGTQSILGCLWEVDDRVAVSFMTSFYNYLDKLPRDEALRRTQLDCLFGRLSNCNVNTANPIFWAGFNLYY